VPDSPGRTPIKPLILFWLLLSGCATAVQGPAPALRCSPSAGYTAIAGYAMGRLRGTIAAENLREPDAQPMTEGLLLSAKSIEAAACGCKTTPDLDRAALALLDGSDADGDGMIGWGLPQEYDAFGDNSTNPAGHEYTITTAVVLNGLLDYRPLAPPAVRMRIDDTVRMVAETWTTRVWNDEEGFYWYSPAESDRVATMNVTSMMAGVLTRAAATVALPPATRATVDRQAGKVIALLTRSATAGVPFWRYTVTETARTEDLMHHIYTVHGVEMIRAAGHRVPWTSDQILESLAGFWDGERLMEYPKQHRPAGPLGLRPARLWGAGGALALAAGLGDTATVNRLRGWIDSGIYGKGPAFDLWPNTDPRHRTQAPSPRHLAHVAWGMAMADMGWVYGEVPCGR